MRSKKSASSIDNNLPGDNAMEAISHVVINLTIFVLAIYVGYHVVWT